MHRKLSLAGLMFCTALIAYAPAAMADKGGHGHGHGHGKKHHVEHGGNVVITSSDRVIIRNYLSEDFRSSCPPGLAKKHNGCLPPGHAKRYVIGQPLAVEWVPVPATLSGRLHAPAGYEYVMVDKDVLLISEASHHVIDAITLASAVGR